MRRDESARRTALWARIAAARGTERRALLTVLVSDCAFSAREHPRHEALHAALLDAVVLLDARGRLVDLAMERVYAPDAPTPEAVVDLVRLVLRRVAALADDPRDEDRARALAVQAALERHADVLTGTDERGRLPRSRRRERRSPPA